MEYECWDVCGKTLEFIEDEHLYIYDGVVVDYSITEMLKYRFGNKYAGIAPEILKRAADKGTAVHEAIENWCKTGEESELPEVRNFKFLKNMYNFEVIKNEVPVVLHDKDGELLAAGRLDLVLVMDGKVGGADIKRTATLDKEYLAYQLNLYRIAYRQCYGVEWEFLRGVHLRDNVRKFVEIPIREDQIWGFIDEWKRNHKYFEGENGKD